MSEPILTPLQDQILVELLPLPEKTGSIIRVDRQEYTREALTLAVGPEVRDVDVGDIVLVTTLAGQEIGGQLLLPESSVLAFVESREPI